VPQFLARTVEKSRGRVEVRTLECTSLLTCFELWPGLKQGFRLTRTITCGNRTTTEVVHGITSLSEARADAAELLERVRGHWRVENQLHYVRDVTLGEDDCRVRSGNAPEGRAEIAHCRRLLGESTVRRQPRRCPATTRRSTGRGAGTPPKEPNTKLLVTLPQEAGLDSH
jgi:hypothetical protein